MHRQTRYISALLALFLLLVPWGALAESASENLVLNPHIDDLSFWYADSWNSAYGYSSMSLDDTVGHGDSTSLYVENMQENDARFKQTIWVEPSTIYRISCYVMAEGCLEDREGANLSIEDIFVSTDSVHDTAGQWQYIEMYGETGPEQVELTLMARVGNYGSTTTGCAWFDDFEMVAVDSAPEGVMLYSFSTPAPVIETETDVFSDEEPPRNTPALLLIAALFAILACAGWTSVRRMNEAHPNLRGHGEGTILAVLLAVAFVGRLYLAVRYPGYRVDINCFEAWGTRLLNLGPLNFYNPGSYFCDYPPLYLSLLAVTEFFRSLLGIVYDGTLHRLLVRIWPIICDILTAILIYRVGQRHIGKTSAAALATLHAFNIAGMAISAAWGQADSVLTLLLCLSLLLTVEKKWTPALAFYVLAVLTKPQALLFAPVGVTFFICDIVRTPGKRLRLLASAGIAVALAYVCLLPFSVNLYDGALGKLFSPLTFLTELFMGTTSGYKYMTVNALNLYCALDLNWANAALHPVLYAISWVLMLLGMAYACLLTAISKHRRNVLLTAAAMMSLIFAFGPMMHERYLYPVIVLLVLFFALTRDRRALMSAIICSATLFLNTTLVLQGGMGTGNYGHLNSAEQWVNAIVSIVNVFNALYIAYIAFSACVLGHISRHADQPDSEEPAAYRRLARRRDARLRLSARDYIIMLAVSAVYAVVAFTNLGVTTAPQTEWVATDPGESVIFDLGQTQPFRMTYYGGICSTHFTVALSDDGVTWSDDYAAEYAQGTIFRWLYYVPKTVSGGKFSNMYGEPASAFGAPTTYFAGNILPDALAAFDHSSAYPPQQARYVRITAMDAGLKLREIGFLNAGGEVLPVCSVTAVPVDGQLLYDEPEKLIDEQSIVEPEPSYLNGTYFDEIYHARTAYEHQQGEVAYEWTHPPLGKVLIMVGINLFGMTPFGWRFMGALIGVLMLPLMYLLAKQLTHRRDISTVAMLLMALDSMHFTQTRIATVDSFAVFFIMLMYLFMFRYQQMNWNHDRFHRTLIPLGLCGISMGLGIAAKWIGVYAAIGLAAIFFCVLWRRFAEHRQAVRALPTAEDPLPARINAIWLTLMSIGAFALLFSLFVWILPQVTMLRLKYTFLTGSACDVIAAILLVIGFVCLVIGAVIGILRRREPADDPMLRARDDFWKNAILTCLFCLLFFIVIPLVIYYFSYYWQLRGEANGLNLSRVIQLQESMLSYHAGLGDDTHYFRSEWYEWPIIWWPIWYYSGTEFMPAGVISSISCMGNPAVWWSGLISLIAVFCFLAARKRKPDSYHLVIIGFLSQFLPWVLVPRSTFIYHYFASVPFIILCTALMLDRIRRSGKKAFLITAGILVAAALILFVMFYPLESGLPVSRAYANLLRWFRWYNF